MPPVGELATGEEKLAALDPELFHRLTGLRNHEYRSQGATLKDLCLTFVCPEDMKPEYLMAHGEARQCEKVCQLKSRGAKIEVTEENLSQYIELMTNHLVRKWSEGISAQVSAVQVSLRVLLTSEIQRVFPKAFTLAEIASLLGGIPEITREVVADWKRHTKYDGGLTSSDKLARWFWNIVEEFSPEDRARLLGFTTGSPNPPPLGFATLPGFNGGTTSFTLMSTTAAHTQLPTASTCFCTLKLPRYRSQSDLRQKLEKAMKYSCGFAEAAVAQ